MLNEAKISRPRPRPRQGLWGQGQSFEVKAEAEANFSTSRPRPRPKTKLWIKSIKWWLTTYRRIYIIMIKTTLTPAKEVSNQFTYPQGTLSKVSGWVHYLSPESKLPINKLAQYKQLCWLMLNTTPVPIAWAVVTMDTIIAITFNILTTLPPRTPNN